MGRTCRSLATSMSPCGQSAMSCPSTATHALAVAKACAAPPVGSPPNPLRSEATPAPTAESKRRVTISFAMGERAWSHTVNSRCNSHMPSPSALADGPPAPAAATGNLRGRGWQETLVASSASHGARAGAFCTSTRARASTMRGPATTSTSSGPCSSTSNAAEICKHMTCVTGEGS